MLSDATKQAATAARSSREPRREPETNFDAFCLMNGIGHSEAARFMECVEGCGGGEHTDCLTLAKLYDVWTALGREGRDGDYDDDEQKALRDVTRIWCRGVVRGELSTEVRR